MPFMEFLLNSFDLPTIFWEYDILIYYTHNLLYDAHILLAILVILIYNYIIIIIF